MTAQQRIRAPFFVLVGWRDAYKNPRVKTVCASSVLFGREAFETLGETLVIPDRRISREHLKDADMLIVRSKTNVDAELLEGTKVSFVGTATAGYDHLHTRYLDARRIAWCSAPGCNANSVAEYVTAAICRIAHCRGYELEKLTLGVIGVGQVGGRVAKKAEVLGMRVLRNDPPLALATEDPAYLPLDRVLEEADVLTLHVPLTNEGRFPTHHMCSCHFFEHARPGCIFVNAARGEVVDTESLLFALERHAVGHAVLDTWENEPFISAELLAKVAIATPHIAGYSFEGRLNGTEAVYREACHFFEVEPKWRPNEGDFPAPADIAYDALEKSQETALCEIISSGYDIGKDDNALRQAMAMATDARGTHFDALRRSYSARREFTAVHVKLINAGDKLAEKVRGLGFRVTR